MGVGARHLGPSEAIERRRIRNENRRAHSGIRRPFFELIQQASIVDLQQRRDIGARPP
jgi:hypothetical protein